MPTSTITSRGQTVIPKSVRERLGLRPGDQLDYTFQESGDLVVRPVTGTIRDLYGCLASRGAKRVSLADMDKAVRKRASGR